MVENRVEWRLAPRRADDGAEDRGHPQQCDEASAESDAAERRESDENGHAQEKANQHLDRFQFLRQVRELRQGCKLLYILRVLTGAAALPLVRFR